MATQLLETAWARKAVPTDPSDTTPVEQSINFKDSKNIKKQTITYKFRLFKYKFKFNFILYTTKILIFILYILLHYK